MKSLSPLGVAIFTSSPTLWSRRAWPIGDSALSRPSARFASVEPVFRTVTRASYGSPARTVRAGVMTRQARTLERGALSSLLSEHPTLSAHFFRALALALSQRLDDLYSFYDTGAKRVDGWLRADRRRRT